jgi:hypothetical protein
MNSKRTNNPGALCAWPTTEGLRRSRFSLGKLALLARLMLALRTLPVLLLDLGTGVETRCLRKRLGQRTLGLRLAIHLAITVLVIPATASAYTMGAEKQTLRRMCRKAEKQGVQCRRVIDAGERRALLERAIVHEQTNPNPLYRRADPNTADLLDIDHWMVAHSRDGTPLVLSVTPIGGNCAALRYFRTLEASDEATLARYLLTAHLVEELRQREVAYLVDIAPPHDLTSGIRHFASMVGFTVARATLPDHINRSDKLTSSIKRLFVRHCDREAEASNRESTRQSGRA